MGTIKHNAPFGRLNLSSAVASCRWAAWLAAGLAGSAAPLPAKDGRQGGHRGVRSLLLAPLCGRANGDGKTRMSRAEGAQTRSPRRLLSKHLPPKFLLRVGLACAEQTFPPSWHQLMEARGDAFQSATLSHVSRGACPEFSPSRAPPARPRGAGAAQLCRLWGCSGLPPPRHLAAGADAGAVGKLSAGAGLPRSHRRQPARHSSCWRGTSRALPKRGEGRKSPGFSWKQIQRANQQPGMGLILADSLLTLSRGETVKTRAGDVEIDGDQYKLSPGANAPTSAGLRREKALTPCADASTRKSRSSCPPLPFAAVLLLEKQTKSLNPPKSHQSHH